jgi:RHS repeat-associated protein
MPNGDNGDQYDFASLDRDLEDNTEHAQFRNYSVNQGRWLTPDPYLGSYDFTNPQSFNRYAYALNNPVSNIDPSGLDCVFFDDNGRPYLGGDEDGTHSEDDLDPKQCGMDGGDWVDGNVNSYSFDESTGIYTFNSSDAQNNYQTTAYNPDDQLGYTGTSCSGDCVVDMSQSPNASGLSDYLGPGLIPQAPNNCISPGVCQSKIDNLNLMEKGKTNYRDPFSICSTHTTVDNSTGATSSHVDLFNPGTSIPTGPMTGNIPALPFHLLFDALPDAIYNLTGHYLLPAGRGLCQ